MSVIYKIIYPNGKIYVGTAAYGRNAYLVEFDPATEKLRIVLDVHKLVGLPLTATGYAAQSKLHTRNFVGPSGKIYVGSKQGYPTAAEYAALRRGETIPTYRGGYVIVYDPATDTAENLGLPMPIERKPAGATEGEGVIDVTADEARGLIERVISPLFALAGPAVGRARRHLQQRLGITFIHVTHDQDEAMSMSDRIAVMNAGRVEQLGTPEELYEQPKTKFVAQFIGECNFLAGKFISRSADIVEADTPVGRLRLQLAKAGVDVAEQAEQGQLSIGIRPERISLQGGDPGDNRCLGRIEEITYNGAESRYRVVVGEAELRVTELNSGRRAVGLFVGDAVEVAIPPANLFLLEG